MELNMNILKQIYDKKLAENESSITYWEDHLRNLESLDFTVFSDKLRVPMLVPISSRILFRGELKHTNEITVPLGADYFVKCSSKQAETLKQRRIKDAEIKLDILKKEKKYLESQINFSQENIFEDNGNDIIEVHTDEEDRAWRKAHRDNVKKYKQNKEKTEEYCEKEISDETLWNRLDELELQEELENELSVMDDNTDKHKDENVPSKSHHQEQTEGLNIDQFLGDNNLGETRKNGYVVLTFKENEKFNLLQEVLSKQAELEKQLAEIKNTERTTSKTEDDLMSRLDEIEQIEEIEDEMERLTGILEEDNENKELEEQENNKDTKRSVTFADEDESETLELNFTHSTIEPCMEPYNPENGIMKPNDIYAAYSHLFNETTSILKKTKYEHSEPQISQINKIHNQKYELPSNNSKNVNETIMVKDISEKSVNKELAIDANKTRPISIFKKQRQKKS